MNMNHVDLTVTDVQAASEFLKTYFGLDQQKKRTGMAVLIDNDEFVLTVMETDEQSTVTYPHIPHRLFCRK
jgi:lactoylglutathione lyase